MISVEKKQKLRKHRKKSFQSSGGEIWSIFFGFNQMK